MNRIVTLAMLSVLAGASCRGPAVQDATRSNAEVWPRRVEGNWVTKTFTFRAELVSVKARPTVVHDNLDLRFRILDDSVPAEYFSIHYPRYREKKPELEILFGAGDQAVFQLTVDAIAIGEMSNGGGTVLVGGLKTLKKE